MMADGNGGVGRPNDGEEELSGGREIKGGEEEKEERERGWPAENEKNEGGEREKRV